MKKRRIFYCDDLEESVGEMLTAINVDFVHESESATQVIDFFLPKHDIYIEVKQFYSVRISKQMESNDNIIAIQGRKSIVFLKQLLLCKTQHLTPPCRGGGQKNESREPT